MPGSKRSGDSMTWRIICSPLGRFRPMSLGSKSDSPEVWVRTCHGVTFSGRRREAGGGREKVTPWHVLTHTSGLSDFDPRDIGRKRPSGEQMMRHVIESPLRFEPGTKWEYVSASFYLLTMIIERVSGTEYRRYLDERVQHPLGMHTTFDPRRAGRPIVAVQGIGVDSRLTRFLVLRYMARAALPGGGLFGTLDDLTRFGAALLRPRQINGRHLPLRAETIAEMARDQLHGEVSGESDEEVRAIHHGLGWGKPTLMRDVPGSANVFSHGGRVARGCGSTLTQSWSSSFSQIAGPPSEVLRRRRCAARTRR